MSKVQRTNGQNQGVLLNPGNFRIAEMLSRQAIASFLGRSFQGARQLYSTLGYERTLIFQHFLAFYTRTGLGKRIVNAPADATWRREPKVCEDKENENETEFEKQFNSLVKRLRLWNKLNRVDRLSGIGRYGVLVIGTKGAKLEDPLKPKSLKSPDDVLFIQPFSEGSARIQVWNNTESSPRFGKPSIYAVDTGTAVQVRSRRVHWSRVIHISEGILEDEVYGVPRLEACYNRIQDHEKVLGGSAEMFWQGAFRGPVFSLNQGTADQQYVYKQEDDDALQSAMKDKMEAYIHGLQRTLLTQGSDVSWPNTINPNPEKIIDGLISDISSATGIPQRILRGSERGELASSQDETNWNNQITERRTSYAEPVILRPLVDRLIEAGALPEPDVEEYYIEWPNLFELSDMEKADLAGKTATAIKDYAPPGATDLVVPVGEFREKVLGFPAEPESRFIDMAQPEQDRLIPEPPPPEPTPVQPGQDQQNPDQQDQYEEQ